MKKINTNIYGPITLTSYVRKKYYITFIDDYSRKCWVYLLKENRKRLGTDLTRDGFHLSFAHGRYIASCAWLEAVLGVNPVGNTYCPEGMTPEECKLAQKAAHKAVKKPSKVSKIK